MGRSNQTWEWDALSSQRQIPRWIEVAIVAIGLPIVLAGIFFIVLQVGEISETAIMVGLIILVSVCLAYLFQKLDSGRERGLNIRVDNESITCKLHGRTKVYSLKQLDWSRVEMTRGAASMLVLARLGDDHVRKYPILLMNRACRRELWQLLTRHRKPCAESAFIDRD